AWVSRLVTGPLKAMVRATQAFSQGQPHGDLPLQRQDEIGELARSFHDMEQQIGRHMTELNTSRDAMSHLAHHDALTGLPNRRMFEQRLAQALELSRRSGRDCAVLFVDLDDFKGVNDAHGHAVGDLVLQAAARTITGAVRQADTVARLAGDEFTVLCENVDTEDAALQVAAKLKRAFDTPLVIEGQPLRVRPSIGLSLFPRDAQDAHSLLASADAAMYRSKPGHRGHT
ncbi:MAG: diguanylate cyclase, partial [Comamonadaceae bacterium]